MRKQIALAQQSTHTDIKRKDQGMNPTATNLDNMMSPQQNQKSKTENKKGKSFER